LEKRGSLMDTMEGKKKTGLIATAVTAFVCGCPSLCVMAFGIMFVIGDDAPQLSGLDGVEGGMEIGIAFLCVGFVIALIPLFAAGYTFMIWQKAKNEDEYATKGEVETPAPMVEQIVDVESKEVLEELAVSEEDPDDAVDDDEIPPAI
jgi:hypothetical protein